MARDPKNLRIDPTHCRAICDEIGERLRESLGREAADMPPYLRRLVDRLGQLGVVARDRAPNRRSAKFEGFERPRTSLKTGE